jgi:branched-subunit amino acid ABC-type transport system permease component
MAAILGINTDRVISLVFMIGASMAIQVSSAMPQAAASRMNTLVQVICTTPLASSSRNTPLSSVGTPDWHR